MSALLFSRIDTDLLYEPFFVAVAEMLADMQREGIEFHVTSGFRNEAQQMKLWTQGRTQPGPIVTNARALESAHNFGIAVDLTRDSDVKRPGIQPSWRNEDYEVLDRACHIHGLEWGGWWRVKDRPHVQLAGYVTATQLKPLAEAWKKANGTDADRLAAAWRVIDSKSPKQPN